MQILKTCFITSLLIFSVRAGTFTNDFNSGTPPGSALYGHAVITPTGGVDNSGVLKLTQALGSQSSSFIVNDLDAGAAVYGFDMQFKVRIDGGGTPADGFSVNFAPDLPQGPFGEAGAGTGITVTFDIYINGDLGETSRSIQVKAGGQEIARRNMSHAEITTGANFEDVRIRVNPDGSMEVFYKGQAVIPQFFIPGHQPISAGQFGFGGRTGGAFANQWIDNLGITTFTQPEVGFAVQPASRTVVAGSDVTLVAEVTNTDGASFQWFRDGAVIPGAVSPTLSLPDFSLADSGDRFTLTVTGPNNTITSDEVVITARDVPGPTAPQINYTFDSASEPPAGSFLFTSDPSYGGRVTPVDGVNSSGVLHLTDAVQDIAVRGGLIIEDFNSGAPVYGFTSAFDARLGGGTTPPADGFSFNFGNNISDDPQGDIEDGIGERVRVGFDIFDNGGGEGPSVDVRVGNTLVAQAKVPLSFLRTDDGTTITYVPVVIRVENDGTIDVAYNGVLLHDNVSLPGFTSITGGRVAIGGRTGGLNENQWIDNLQISTVTTPGELRVGTQPVAQRVVVGNPATFLVELNDEAGATYQWFRNGTAIPGATASTYTIPETVAGDDGALFKVTASRGALSVTSDEVALDVLNITRPGTPTVSYNFDDGQVPSGTTLVGNDQAIAGYITPNGGVGDSGVLHLTDAAGSASGAFVIPAQQGGAEIGSFTAAFDILVGGGTATPADGFSFNFAPDIPNTTIGEAENGGGTGLTIAFDIYDNGATENVPAPSVDIRYKGALVETVQLPFTDLLTFPDFREVLIRLNEGGTVDVTYGDRVLFEGVQLPNYTPIANGKFGFYARTGGANENVWLDNVAILVNKTTAPLRITQDIADVALLEGTTTTFSVLLSDPAGATYQWFRNGIAIPGATTSTYTPAAFTLADDGDKFKVTATGTGGTVTSTEATVTVVPPITVTDPTISFNFDDLVVPEGTQINGVAYMGGEGAIHLTDALQSQGGSFVISDFDNGQPINAMTAHFSLHVGNGSGTPADGLAFVWADDINLAANFGEAGAGTGLIVSFDTYQNPDEQAPAVQVSWNGTVLARKLVPYSLIATGDGYAETYVRVNPNGTLDVQYKDTLLFHNLPLPNFAPISGGLFGFGARTGGEFEEHWIDNVQIATTTGSAPANLTVTRVNNRIHIEWTGGGTLQSSTALGPTADWNDIPGAVSGYEQDMTGGTMFFRVVN